MKTAAVSMMVVLLLAGCETYERRDGKEYLVDDESSEPREDPREKKLIELTEEHPKDSRVWFRLGDFYERRKNYPGALKAYTHMQELIEVEEKKQKRRYPGGLLRLGRLHYQLRSFEPAEKLLQRVVGMELDIRKARRNPSYREAHVILAWIYFHWEDWKLASRHAYAFKDLGGDTRADYVLMKIDERRQRGDVTVEASTSPKKAPGKKKTPKK